MIDNMYLVIFNYLITYFHFIGAYTQCFPEWRNQYSKPSSHLPASASQSLLALLLFLHHITNVNINLLINIVLTTACINSILKLLLISL